MSSRPMPCASSSWRPTPMPMTLAQRSSRAQSAKACGCKRTCTRGTGRTSGRSARSTTHSSRCSMARHHSPSTTRALPSTRCPASCPRPSSPCATVLAVACDSVGHPLIRLHCALTAYRPYMHAPCPVAQPHPTLALGPSRVCRQLIQTDLYVSRVIWGCM